MAKGKPKIPVDYMPAWCRHATKILWKEDALTMAGTAHETARAAWARLFGSTLPDCQDHFWDTPTERSFRRYNDRYALVNQEGLDYWAEIVKPPKPEKFKVEIDWSKLE